MHQPVAPEYAPTLSASHRATAQAGAPMTTAWTTTSRARWSLSTRGRCHCTDWQSEPVMSGSVKKRATLLRDKLRVSVLHHTVAMLRRAPLFQRAALTSVRAMGERRRRQSWRCQASALLTCSAPASSAKWNVSGVAMPLARSHERGLGAPRAKKLFSRVSDAVADSVHYMR